MAINKIIYGDRILIDLTADTVTSDKVLSNYTFHGNDGIVQSGTCTYDSNTQDANVLVAEILKDKTAYGRGVKLTGTMPNNGGVKGIISTKLEQYTIPQGYHDGSGKVSISSIEQSKIIPENIREGVTILGVVGEMSGSESENPEENRTVTPSDKQQVITPSEGYTCLRQVTVEAIPYVESPNAVGGTTVTIG